LVKDRLSDATKLSNKNLSVMRNRVFIIAEAGVNHNGNIDIAKRLVDTALEAGSDAVKFQTFKAENVVTRSASKAYYQKKTTVKNETQYDMLRRLELNDAAHCQLYDYCVQTNIIFMSTPFDLESIELLAGLGMEIYKIPSGEITNLPYLRKIGALNKKVIMSTGMSTIGEIETALNELIQTGTQLNNITVMHCNTEYPTPFDDVNLKAMQTIQKAFPGIEVGYSDHTVGLEVSIAAAAMGAMVIEKHFTLDRHMEGPDHKVSLEPDELKAMVKAIRNIEKAMGSGWKRPSPSELKNMQIVRKSIVAACNIKKGETFTEINLTTKRPGTGINPMRWNEVIGSIAKKNYLPDDML